MKRMNRILIASFVLAVVCVFAVSGPAQAAVLYTGDYFQDFNGLGASGTALPTDWTLWSYGTSASEWNTSIDPAHVKAMTMITSPIAEQAALDTSIPLGSPLSDAGRDAWRDSGKWYNIAHASTSTDRVFSTSPTTVNGLAFQLLLTNNTGAALNNIVVSYDIVKFYSGYQTTGTPSESLPGYQLFYTVVNSGAAPGTGTWTNVSALNPNSTNISQGAPYNSLAYQVYHITNATVGFSTPWGNGQDLYLRWVDDNADVLSPDQIIGIDNVHVAPIPAAAWLLGTGLVGLVALRRRKK